MMRRHHRLLKFVAVLVLLGFLLRQFYLVSIAKSLTEPLVNHTLASGTEPYSMPAVDMESVMQANSRECIRNADRYQPRLDEDGVVIVVLVHDRTFELQLLIDSLRHVRYINETLIVFSHDLIKQDIHQIVSAVDFAPVLQLWYPYSMQLHPHSFPGDSPNDCTRNMSREQAERVRCTNREHPDSHGHYREGKFCQLKHHWLWKLEYVLNEVRALKDFQGTFLRLEDDFYLLPDAIHLIRAVRRLLPSSCPECLIGFLGDRDLLPKAKFSNLVLIEKWRCGRGHGMAFNRMFWRKFKNCSSYFCVWDDYNWDFSLQHAAQCFGSNQFRAWRPSDLRLIHIGRCGGFHHMNKTCSVKHIVNWADIAINETSGYHFPPFDQIQILSNFTEENVSRCVLKNGGWGDTRDHKFCLALFEKTPSQRKVMFGLHRFSNRSLHAKRE